MTLGCIGHTKKSVPTSRPSWLAGGQRRPAQASHGQLRLAMASVGWPVARLGHPLITHENAQVGLSEGHDENKQKTCENGEKMGPNGPWTGRNGPQTGAGPGPIGVAHGAQGTHP